MANVTVASNNNWGKWVPYYYKPFSLGKQGVQGFSTDGEMYIEQILGEATPSNVAMRGTCTSSLNCGFYYIIIIETAGGNDYFYVEKYDLADNLIETIYASETGGSDNGRLWDFGSANPISIDEGVNIFFHHNTNYDDGDKYKVTLPSKDTMIRRRIYHGGYSTFARMPYTEGISYHTDIIPTNLKGKNMTVLFNPPMDAMMQANTYALITAKSYEDILGNRGVTLALEWNVDSSGDDSITAPTTAYSFPADETWQLGSIFAIDIQIGTSDTPTLAHMPSSDVVPALVTTGTQQTLNLTVAGRAGTARMSVHYASGTGTPAIIAHNQYGPIILMLS